MMAYPGLMRRVLGACVALVFMTSCGGSQTQNNALVPSQYNAGASRRPGGQGIPSWAQGHELLYVAHAPDGSVDIYSYPDGELQARLNGVRANGLCSDENGNVFVPASNEILEYAHGGKRPIALFRNSLGGLVQHCTVDPETGNLAVAGSGSLKSGVAVYADARANPKVYTIAGLDRSPPAAAYDDAGNLFLASTTRARGIVALFELPKGGDRFKPVTWSGKPPSRLASIQWDGEHLAALSVGGPAKPASILRYDVSGGRAALAGESALKSAGSPQQFWIHGGDVAVPGSTGVALYGYPAGGDPTKSIADVRAALAATVSVAAAPQFAITTYHYDNLRTGWNDSESTLTYKNVKSGSFGLLHSVTLDDQVDAQPLVVPDETTTRGTNSGLHDVVYVATENDTVYAIDASSGAILFSQSLGSPVPTPLGCNNNGPNVGINGTPVIDLSANVMYVIAYTLEGGGPTYRIHELSLSDLTDVVPSVVVSASHKLSNGKKYIFKARVQRQRPALLEANGNVYAGFGSFCDFNASKSRGWLLGWQTGSLTPLPANRLNDSLAKSPNQFFLSAIWMSGYGLAADPTGNVYFVTGNSDPSGTTYNGVTNIQESVAKVSSDLTQLVSIFTPSDVGYLDEGDVDFGSGGVMLLPSLGSSVPPLAAAAGKDGMMYLLDQNNLGGYNPSHNNDLDQQYIGGCWCGQSYFATGKKAVPRIVASGGNSVTLWNVQTSPSSAKLVAAGSSPGLPGGQDPGFFTTISSHGTNRGAIIWALARPQYVPGSMTLFAFKAQPNKGSSTLATLWQGTAGTWTAQNGNANLVPVVANGKVYVASYQQLDIFGIGGSAAKAVTARGAGFYTMRGAPSEVTGTLTAVSGSLLALRTRSGRIVRVDDSDARAHERSGDLIAGRPFNVRGRYDARGVLHAAFIVRAKPSPGSWPADR